MGVRSPITLAIIQITLKQIKLINGDMLMIIIEFG